MTLESRNLCINRDMTVVIVVINQQSLSRFCDTDTIKNITLLVQYLCLNETNSNFVAERFDAPLQTRSMDFQLVFFRSVIGQAAVVRHPLSCQDGSCQSFFGIQ